MNHCSGIISLTQLKVVISLLSHGAGTKQIMPQSTAKGSIEINKWRSEFGFYNSFSDYRLHIAVSNNELVMKK
jgi:hypothetical protein